MDDVGEGRQQSADASKMHKKLTVGVIALSKSGQVGAASTLGESPISL